MISFVNCLLIILWYIVLPFVLGLTFNSVWTEKVVCIPACMVTGFAVMIAVFQIIAVPMVYINAPFNLLCYTWAAIIGLLSAFSIIYGGKKTKISICRSEGKRDVFVVTMWVLVICMILFQTCLLTFSMHTDTDDVRFISEALEAYEKNTILNYHPITGVKLRELFDELTKELASPYPFFIATISKLTRVHPAITAHVFFPMFLIPLCYGTLYLIGGLLFDNSKKNVVFMFLTSVIMLFSFESVYALGYTLLTIIWQGRSIFATIMLPFLWLYLLKIYEDKCISIKKYILGLIIMLACADLSGMGILMSVVLCAVYSISELIDKKNVKIAFSMLSITAPNVIYFIYYIWVSSNWVKR